MGAMDSLEEAVPGSSGPSVEGGSSAEVKIRRVGVRVVLIFSVVGGLPIDLQTYRSTAIIPDRVTVEFYDGEWRSTEIEGFKEKKDGTPGLDRFTERYTGVWKSSMDRMPLWAQPLMDLGHAEQLAQGGEE